MSIPHEALKNLHEHGLKEQPLLIVKEQKHTMPWNNGPHWFSCIVTLKGVKQHKRYASIVLPKGEEHWGYVVESMQPDSQDPHNSYGPANYFPPSKFTSFHTALTYAQHQLLHQA